MPKSQNSTKIQRLLSKLKLAKMKFYHSFKKLTIGIYLISIIVGFIFMVKLKPVDYRTGRVQNTTRAFNQAENKAACKIPKTSIWPQFMKEGWMIRKNPDCSGRGILAQLNDTDQTLRVFSKYSEPATCCLSQIFRVDGKDKSVNITNCNKILDRIVNVSEMEFLVIKCGPKYPNRVHNFANIPMKPIVQSKIDGWNKRMMDPHHPQVLPLNILIIGIDTVSRSHAYRSIPKTLDLMKGMGFHDFLGYHSIAPSTLTNFMGFLMGLERKSVRESCASNWSTPFDSCPFIWKEFHRNGYVTMYTEDGSGTFNWGGQSGFNSQPTDYYVHPFFLATGSCTSSETVPQFSLRYTLRFIQKYHQTPFFSFTWLAYPFHEDPYSLANLENDTLEFFDSLKSVPGLLAKTVIVVLADHGLRNNYNGSKSGIDAFIERGLPPLFIRFPELLKKRLPELDFILEHNANSLVTPFDLHHTLLHILTLTGGGNRSEEFKPIQPDRQSLLTPVNSETRDCSTVNILEGCCVCNINVNSSEDQLVHNQILRQMLTSTLKTELSRIVHSSNYSDLCDEWVIGPLSSIQIVHKSMNHSNVLVKFSADRNRSHEVGRERFGHGIAEFEANVRVGHKLNENKTIDYFHECRLIGKISRVSLYGNQSWCIGFDTDEDKEMKEFCLCK